MVNNLRMVKWVAPALILAVGLGGCFGHHGRAKAPPATGERPEQLSPADRVAYYQIATTSGLLRARAASVMAGQRGTTRSSLTAGRARLALIRPKSGALRALRGQLTGAIDALLRHETRSAAKAAMRATDRINKGLESYSKGKAVRAVLPD